VIPPRTWGLYAALSYELAQRSGHRVYDRRAFEDAVAVDGIRRLSELAERWWATWDLREDRLAAALVDGVAPRYATRRD